MGVNFERHVLDNTLNTAADNVIINQVIHPLSHFFHCCEKSSIFWTEEIRLHMSEPALLPA
jgi:hypothetical protein